MRRVFRFSTIRCVNVCEKNDKREEKKRKKVHIFGIIYNPSFFFTKS